MAAGLKPNLRLPANRLPVGIQGKRDLHCQRGCNDAATLYEPDGPVSALTEEAHERVWPYFLFRFQHRYFPNMVLRSQTIAQIAAGMFGLTSAVSFQAAEA